MVFIPEFGARLHLKSRRRDNLFVCFFVGRKEKEEEEVEEEEWEWFGGLVEARVESGSGATGDETTCVLE